jgi:hypothetical protein
MFPIKTWKKLNYENKRSSYENGIIGEFLLKENKRVIDSIKFKNNHEFNIAISILKKYGYTPKMIENDESEIRFLKIEREKENNWIDKKEGDMEW